jgi:hypothetical protein
MLTKRGLRAVSLLSLLVFSVILFSSSALGASNVSNTAAPAGSLWIEGLGLHWADGNYEYSIDGTLEERKTDGFEHSGASDGSSICSNSADWVADANCFNYDTGTVKEGSYSAYYSDTNNNADTPAMHRVFYSSDTNITKFSAWYRETSNSVGQGLTLRDSSGNRIAGFYTNNPEFGIYDQTGFNGGSRSGDLCGGSSYNTWYQVNMTFDWSASTFNFSRSDGCSGTGHSLGSHDGISSVYIENTNTGNWGDNSNIVGWFDGIEVSSGGSSSSGPPPGALWIEGPALHWGDIFGDERMYTGKDTGSNPAAASPGNLWMENSNLHYIDQSGNERKTSVGPDVIDSFEDGDLSEYSLENENNVQVSTTKSYKGNYSLQQDASISVKAYSNSLPNIPRADDTAAVRLYIEDFQTAQYIFGVGVEGTNYNQGILAQVRANSNNADWVFKLSDRCDNNQDQVSISDPRDQWLKIQVNRGSDDSHTAKLYDSSGNQIASLSITSSCYSSNDYIVFHANDFGSGGRTGNAYWDYTANEG